MATTLQPTLRGFSIVNETNNITSTAIDSFTQFVSVVETFFGYVIRTFDYLIPPETRDKKIRQWLPLIAPYLLPCLVLIICICCFNCLCSCIGSFIILLFRCIVFIVRFLFMIMFSIIRVIFMRYCCEKRTKMMRGSSKSSVMNERGELEEDPQGYYSNLREDPIVYVC
ncbi:hypothetical protein CTI12_AA142010 [Artemisia annua]|uniref:Uncharacterized protein n=1 Tax=Artemisia annua TaxID=35608 RepID=A0A2U1PKC1_ARTAN|nr:hypothetical protein CTI12_AA142010 [Artemisia annua]